MKRVRISSSDCTILVMALATDLRIAKTAGYKIHLRRLINIFKRRSIKDVDSFLIRG